MLQHREFWNEFQKTTSRKRGRTCTNGTSYFDNISVENNQADLSKLAQD